MTDYFATVALMPDGDLKKIQLEDYKGQYVLLLFYQGDFTPLAKVELLDFAQNYERFANNECQILACSTDSGETHVAWTSKSYDEDGLGKSLPFPLLADHAQTLTRKFDLLDSNQGSSKHALLLLDPNGIIKHKQIGDDKVAFDVDDVLSVVIACKVPLFDHSAFERENVDPPDEIPPPPPATLPPELDSKDVKEDSQLPVVEEDNANSDNTSESNHSSEEIASSTDVMEAPVKKDTIEPKVSIEAFHDQKEIEGSSSDSEVDQLETIDTMQEKLKRELTVKRNQELEEGANKTQAKKTTKKEEEAAAKKKESSDDNSCCLIL